jgi:succinyl-diaminopimelate desuccinylase
MPSIDPVRLLERLIRCPSVTPEEAGVFGVLEDALKPLGFAVTRVTFEGDGSYPVENLFATRAGARSGPHLLFAGHTDVVAPGDPADWTDSPFSAVIRDGVMFGRGAADMKSGVAAFVAAAAHAIGEGTAEAGTISLAITNDEEADAVNGTEKLLAWAAGQGHRFDFAIVGEPSARSQAGDSIKIGRRGSLNGRIVVEGVQGHSAYPERAKNPLPAMAAIVTALSGRLDEGSEYFPATNLEFTSVDVGNATTNVIPARASARFNVRFNERWTPETLAAHLTARATDAVRPFEVRHALEVVGRPSNSFLSPLGPPVELLGKVIAGATGKAPELATFGGTSDARFIAAYCPVVEFGLPGTSMHKVDEHVKVADVHALTDLYAAFIAAYLGTRTGGGEKGEHSA